MNPTVYFRTIHVFRGKTSIDPVYHMMILTPFEAEASTALPDTSTPLLSQPAAKTQPVNLSSTTCSHGI
jgi:hypothetical protein